MVIIYDWLIDYGVSEDVANVLSIILMVMFIALLCIVANFITKKIVIRFLTNFVKKTQVEWDNVLLDRQVFHKLSHIVPAVIIYYFASTFPTYEAIIQKAAAIYIIIVALFVISSLLDAINDIYQTFEISKARPIKGFIQVIKIFMFIIGAVIMIATMIGESPLILLSGIGALSAVFMLVFKDSILGLVAGIQLTTNDMVRVGDWIEMPKYSADGDVIDISLNTVKVQNWDKTITTIPSYALISDSFKNWRGMQSSGGRRIKRSLYIDTTSIMFCTDEMIEKFRHIHYLVEHIESKEKEIEEYNKINQINRQNKVNGRAMTNIGVFRAYVANYLKNHPGINQNMTQIVRQLAPNETGVPLEIYAFSNDVRWVSYEGIQSDIFDHLFAVAPEFGLRIFQNPTGHDLKGFKGEIISDEGSSGMERVQGTD